MGFFCPKLKMHELKLYSGAICHGNEKRWKTGRGTDLSFQNWDEDLVNFNRALENLKNLHFNGLPLTKVYNVWPKKVQGSYIWWNGILIQNLKKNYCFQKWHKEFAKCLPEHLEVSKFELWWYSFKSKVENVWA